MPVCPSLTLPTRFADKYILFWRRAGSVRTGSGAMLLPQNRAVGTKKVTKESRSEVPVPGAGAPGRGVGPMRRKASGYADGTRFGERGTTSRPLAWMASSLAPAPCSLGQPGGVEFAEGEGLTARVGRSTLLLRLSQASRGRTAGSLLWFEFEDQVGRGYRVHGPWPRTR